jgi:hypothetical protein
VTEAEVVQPPTIEDVVVARAVVRFEPTIVVASLLEALRDIREIKDTGRPLLVVLKSAVVVEVDVEDSLKVFASFTEIIFEVSTFPLSHGKALANYFEVSMPQDLVFYQVRRHGSLYS